MAQGDLKTPAERTSDGALIYSVSGGSPKTQADAIHRQAMQMNRERIARMIGSRLGQAYAGPLGALIGEQIGARGSQMIDKLQSAIESPSRNGRSLITSMNVFMSSSRTAEPSGPAATAMRRPRLA